MKKDAARRQAENADLLARLKRGESLARIDHQASWWPPRPIIQKDADAVRRLYGDKTDEPGSGES